MAAAKTSLQARESQRSQIVYPGARLTQGTIFVGGRAEAYTNCPVSGLIITARCDVANDKTDYYNYLPVVSFEDWIDRDGKAIIGARLLPEATRQLRDVISAAGESLSILESEPLDRIRDHLFPDGRDKKTTGFRDRFTKASAKHALALAAIKDESNKILCKQIALEAPDFKDNLLKELFSYRLSGYYFLPQVDVTGDDLGFVVLLREIQILPRKLAVAISEGLSAETFGEMCRSDPRLEGRLDLSTFDLAMPVGLLDSPNVEHLMQTFSMLFGRIGIRDLDIDYVHSLWHRQPSLGEQS